MPPLDERERNRIIRHHVRRLGKLGIAIYSIRQNHTNTTREGVTNSEGHYEFVQLAPGNYALTLSATGFVWIPRGLQNSAPEAARGVLSCG